MRGKRLRCWLLKKKSGARSIVTKIFSRLHFRHAHLSTPSSTLAQSFISLTKNYPRRIFPGDDEFMNENTIQGKHFFVSLFPILILCDFIRCLSNKNNYCNLSRCEKNGEKQFKIYNLRLFRLISNKSSETLAHTSSSSYNSRSTLIRNYFQYYPSVSGYQNIIQIVSQRNQVIPLRNDYTQSEGLGIGKRRQNFNATPIHTHNGFKFTCRE